MQPQHSKIDYLLVELIVRQIIYQWLNYLTSSKQLTTLFKYQISQNPLFKSTTTLFPNIVFVALKIKEEFYSSSLSLFLDPMLICFFPTTHPSPQTSQHILFIVYSLFSKLFFNSFNNCPLTQCFGRFGKRSFPQLEGQPRLVAFSSN